MRDFTLRLLASVLLLCGPAVACGGATSTHTAAADTPLSFSPTAQQLLASTSGSLRVAVRTSPSTPVMGANAVQLTITDPNGAAVTGLTLVAQPWMPDMGHGTSVVPTVTSTSAGVYLISNVYFSMAGTWDLIVKSSGTVADSLTISFYVP